MRNRPLWQVLVAILIWAPIQQYLRIYDYFFTFDSLIALQIWLVRIAVLAGLIYAVGKIGERGRAFAHVVVVDDFTDDMVSGAWKWLLAGLVYLTGILIWLEYSQPFFFTQDDNLAQFLPVILQGGRSLAHGSFPTWNPYQLLGAPTTSMGIYALTYPFTYVFYFLSRFVFQNEYLTIEVYCIFHIVAGYLALYWAARCYRVRPAIAAIAALCAVLSGWSLIASRSWFYVSPIFVYMPLLVVGIAKLRNQVIGWKWIAGMALVIGLFFHAGNAQFWAYGMMFLWIALLTLWWSGLIDGRKILSSVSATLLGIALACPLLVPQFLQTRDAARLMNPDAGSLLGQWRAFLVPGPWVNADAPSDWIDPDWKVGGLAIYSGTTFILAALILCACFVLYRSPRKAIGQNVWFIAATIAFLTVIGRSGVIWPVMLYLPLFSKFRIPLKFLAFFNVFVVLAGALVLERILRHLPARKFAEAGIFAVTAALLAASCLMPLPSWYTYQIQPYPNATPVLKEISGAQDRGHRIFSLSLARSVSERYWEGLPHNLPTVYQVPSLFGYDTFIEASPRFFEVKKKMNAELLRSLQEYAVEYVLIPNDFEHPRFSGRRLSIMTENGTPVLRRVVPKMRAACTVVFQDDEVAILRVPDAKTLAYLEQSPMASLPIKLNGNGFDLDVSSAAQGSRVIANFFWYPGFKAEVDGRSVPLSSDSWHRLAWSLPPGSKQVRVRFVPPWGKGFGLGFIVAVAGLVFGYCATRPRKAATEA